MMQMGKSQIQLMLIIAVNLLIQVRSQVDDPYTLRINPNPSSPAVCFENPLQGIERNLFGFYDIWFYIDPYQDWTVNLTKITNSGQNYDSEGNPYTWSYSYFMMNIYEGYYNRYQVSISSGWNNIAIGFSEQSSNWFAVFGRWYGYFNVNNFYPHPPKFCLWGMQANSVTPYILQNEIKLWAFNINDFNPFNDWWERFFSRSYKYYAGTPSSYLIDYYRPYPELSNYTWTSVIQSKSAQVKDILQSYWFNTTSINQNQQFCYPGYLKNMSYWNCTQCQSPCLECSIYNSSKCFACVKGFVYKSYGCTKADCAKGQFFNDTTKTCQSCPSPCSSCDDEPSCLFCQSGFKYVDDGSKQCIQDSQECPFGTFADTQGIPVCRKCPNGCSACLNSTYCTTCVLGSNFQSGQCSQKQCPMGSTYNSTYKRCSNCIANCQQCTYSTCVKCNPDYFLDPYDSTCKSTCPEGFYADKVSESCMRCATNCTKCIGNNFTCTECNSITFLYNNSCVGKCPILGYFQNILTKKCEPCDPQCQTCVASATDCVVCNPGSLFNNRKCVNTCGNYQYASPLGFCYPCDPSCKVCNGSLNSQCSLCNPGYYLLGTTCYENCPALFYANLTSGLCEACPFYCDSCKTKDTCDSCKPGFIPITKNCSGDYVLKTGTNRILNLPVNPDTVPALYDPKELTTEIWFKVNVIGSADTQVFLGMSPYKLRKKGMENSIHLNFQGTLQFCSTEATLISNTWYHFSFTISEKSYQLACYLNGQVQDNGNAPLILIVQNVQMPTEIVIGGTLDKKNEVDFNGYIKEFRLWNQSRSDFQLKNFMYVSFTTSQSNLIAYWKFDEVNDGTVTLLKDSSGKGTNTMNPQIAMVPAFSIQKLIEFKEVLHLVCDEGHYPIYNETLGYQACLPCNPLCKNCIDETDYGCIECNLPYKLMQDDYTCRIIESCPIGYYMDPISGLCYKCSEFCYECKDSPNNCQTCKPMSFRQYEGPSCVGTCPVGMYGNYNTQLCYFNPVIDWITPDNDKQFLYGTFIDVKGNFTMLNSEPKSTYTYGWKIRRLSGDVDISNDVVKPYYQTDIREMHLDNNVLQPYNFYSLTLYVEGNSTYYKGLYSDLTNVIYVGSTPKNGKCVVNVFNGIATVTSFKISQVGWVDTEIITKYEYLYSFDGGHIYLPIETDGFLKTQISHVFQSVYDKYQDVRILCRAVNLKGFSAQASTIVTLERKSTADASKDLQEADPEPLESEAEMLDLAQMLKLITKSLGSMEEQSQNIFDPKIGPADCLSKLCSDNGKCQYLSYTKKYYCNCTNLFGGQNCTFNNKTQIEDIQKILSDLANKYVSLQERQYETEFLLLVSTFKEVITDVTFDVIVSLINQKLIAWQGTKVESATIQTYLGIVSNLLEYLEYDIVVSNATKKLMNDTDKQQAIDQKMKTALELFDYFRQTTLSTVGMLNPEVQMTTRMISYRQLLISQDSLVSISATNNTRRSFTTWIKISEINFDDVTVPLEKDFIVETLEFAINPYQIINTQSISNNIFEVNLYNASDRAKATIKNLKNGFQFYFPYQDNQNLTDFMTEYMSLSPYKAKQQLKRQTMLTKSGLNCTYWNGTGWNTSGCTFLGLDKTHIRCECNHLTAIVPQFITPINTNQVIATENDLFKKSKEDAGGEIILDDLIVPLNNYFKNLQELLQHKSPNPVNFLFKPGPYVVLIFWIMYISSLVYYSGRDRQKRESMTKSQNRDDLAEINDDQIQSLEDMIKELMARDFQQVNKHPILQDVPFELKLPEQDPLNNSQYLNTSSRENQRHALIKPELFSPQNKQNNGSKEKLNSDTQKFFSNLDKARTFEELSKQEQKELKKRARKRVFGRVGGVFERAKRTYKKTFAKKMYTPENKMKFFNDALKNNLWFGLMAKTSKIAPRHVRLTIMYLYISIHLILTSFVYILGLQLKLSELIGVDTYSTLAVAILPLIAAWIVGVPVALIFRMPMSKRQLVEGVRAKKLNVVFSEIDSQMGIRYAIGYFISFIFYILMTIIVIFFNYVYPADYCMGWLFMVIILYFLDLLVFTFGFAGFQLMNILLSLKCKFFYYNWALFEIIRYYKNLRG